MRSQIAMLSVVVFIVATALPAVSEVIRDQTTLPASIVPASEHNPPCQAGNQKNTADFVLSGISTAIDAWIGYPITKATLSATGASQEVSNWLGERLGLNNGKAACQTLCIAYPGTANAQFQTCMSPIPGRGVWACTGFNSAPSHADADHYWEFGAAVNSSVGVKGKAKLFCATGKNWAHEDARTFAIEVTY
jgi:hypothetical protein